MSRANRFFCLCLIAGMFLACGSDENQGTTVAEAKSNKARITSPNVPSADSAALAAGNSQFALNLYKQLSVENANKNLFYSPHSISIALAMLYGGAATTTEKQIADTLSFTLPQSQLHPAFNQLDLALTSRGQGAKASDGTPFKLSIANAIWGQQDFKFLPAYLDLLAQNYGAGLKLVDFLADSEKARLTINQWVADQTAGKIKDLMPKDSINPSTVLVLTNAVYFNAAWKNKFNKSSTAPGDFTLLDNSKVQVPLMNAINTIKYASVAGVQAVELPYDGDELSMVLLLPEAGQFATAQEALTSDGLKALLDALTLKSVDLTLPSFKIETEYPLSDTLKNMGMTDAFGSNADFSGIDGAKDLFVQAVIHKAFVAVDENGTEAAAATGISVGRTAVPSADAVVRADRPFFFLIRDIQTGAIIFMGRVVDPR